MVFPADVWEVEVSHKDKKRKTIREKTSLKKDWGVLVDKKQMMSELCIFEAIITYWTTLVEVQLPNQGMILFLSTQAIHI